MMESRPMTDIWTAIDTEIKRDEEGMAVKHHVKKPTRNGRPASSTTVEVQIWSRQDNRRKNAISTLTAMVNNNDFKVAGLLAAGTTTYEP